MDGFRRIDEKIDGFRSKVGLMDGLIREDEWIQRD